MSKTWSIGLSLAAFGLLVLLAIYPRAFSAEEVMLPEETFVATPMNHIEKDAFHNDLLESDDTPGMLGVDAIQSLPSANSVATTEPAGQMVPVSLMTPSAPVVQTMPAFAVFPVILHESRNKAFSDLSVLLSTSFASQLLERQRSLGIDLGVLNPIYTYDELKEKGLDRTYQKLVEDYVISGQPNERDVRYIARQLSSKNRDVKWVAFVEADFNLNRMMAPSGIYEQTRSLLWEKSPKEPNYQLMGRVRVYNLENGMSLVMDQATQSRMRMSQFSNFSRSVFDDGDSTLNFKRATDQMALSLVGKMPEQTFQSLASVQGKVVGGGPYTNLSPEDQESLKRILNY